MKLHVIDQSLLTGKDGKLDDLVDQAKDQEIAKEYANGLPKQFDLILLGCGPDGHLALYSQVINYWKKETN